MRELATIQRIKNIRPIEGADRIAVAEVLGWEVVIRKEEFKVNDLCVYIETDSIVPALPEFEFLKERKYRVRTIRLKKQVSQGLCLPLTIFPSGGGAWTQEGKDVTSILGIKKYDPEAEKEARLQDQNAALHQNRIDRFLRKYAWYRRFFTKVGKRQWPDFIKKTDEERIQRIPSICEREAETRFISTEKLDGQSATYALLRLDKKWWHLKDRYQFFVCSRNVNITTPNNSSYWTIAKNKKMERVLHDLIFPMDKFIYIQGEIVGPGIQNNKYNLKEFEFYAFNLVRSSYKGKCDQFITELELNKHNIKCVPVDSVNFQLDKSISESVEKAKGKSVLHNIHREGIVVRHYDKNISFKIINPDFLLKYQDEEIN